MRRRTAGILGASLVVLVVAVVVGASLLLNRPATPTAALGPPRFVDETSTAGLDQTFAAGPAYDVGGGVAVFDCDGDRKPDVYVAGGVDPATLFRNESTLAGPLRFSRVAAPVTDLTDVMGAYPLDVDGDGNVDLAVLRAGESVMLRGLGGCRFERANEAWHVAPTPGWTTAFSATWEAASALPTLAFGSYVTLDAEGNATYSCPDNQLIRPAPGGAAYAAPVPLTPGFCALSMLFSDWDRSGRRDLRISNDRQYYDPATGEEQLWRVEAGQAPRPYTDADGWALLQLWGMGIASYDVTGDGYPEVYLTSQGPNTLQTLTAGPAQPTFRDLALKRHLEATRPVAGGDPLPSTAWHPEFQDVNNDGFMDLFVSKGNVGQQPDYAVRDPNNLFLGQPDGMYAESSEAAGIVAFDRGRGAAVADFNEDGLPDLVVVNLDAPVRVWRNVGGGTPAAPSAMGNWLAVALQQPGGNRDAIGAILEVKVGDLVTRREIVVGGGHISGELGPIHLGLGPADQAELRVTWPDGELGPWLRVAANQYVDVVRGATEVVPWSPR